MKRLLVLALLLAICRAVAVAQNFSLIDGRETVTSLDGLWRFQIGDNPAWADPNFNDSNWPLIRSDESWTKQGFPAFNGYAWYRFKIEVPGDGQPVALLLTDIINGYQLYVNGKLIGSAGSATSTRDPVFNGRPTTFLLPISGKGPQSVQVALRVWSYYPIASWTGAGTRGKGNEVGNPARLSLHRQAFESNTARYYVNEYAYGLSAGLIGLAILALFLYRPSDKEYLWFSILLLGQLASALLHLMLNLGSLPMPLWDLLRLIAQAASVLAAMAFFSTVLHAHRSFLWHAICVAVAVSPLTAALIYFQWTGMGVSFAIEGTCILSAFIWIVVRLLIGAVRGDASARLLLLPVVLSYGLDCIDLTARILRQLGRQSTFLSSIDANVSEWPYPTYLGDAVSFIFLLALLIFLVRRFSLARKEEERMAAELDAARTVQSLLIPAKPPLTPGFAVENVYLPAQEVGGDFFQILPDHDGSLLIVVGDVSGKGLRAAMTVSAIVGALRGCKLRTPEKVLTHLSCALHGQVNGFFTCCVALVNPDGKLTIANAGHLPPYLNGEELEVNPGLPLGIALEADYPEVIYHFGLQDRLAFVSDGVVEARNGSGELYGFVRTRTISNQSAESIARAAQQFGQEDDITVLTVARVDQGPLVSRNDVLCSHLDG